MATFSIIRAGVETFLPRDPDLITADTLAWVEAETGVGMAPLGRERQQGPLQHGASDRGFRLQPRTLTLIFGMEGATAADLDRKREALVALCAPADDPLQLRWVRDDGQTRQLDAHASGNLDYGSADRVGRSQRAAVVFAADDPTCYDPTGVSVSFGIAAGGQAFNVPLSIPWTVGASVVDQTVAVGYAGTWRTSPVVIIQGPITDPVITNLTTGAALDLTGTTVAAGDAYTVDTRYGAGTVLDAAGASRIAALSDASDLTTFTLASRADVPDGVNALRVTGTAATAATQVFVQFYTRYLSL